MKMIKKAKSGGGGDNDWMNTYADMVTLLMCFFVLLYSMSSIDSNKFKILVQAFNPDAKEEVETTDKGTNPGDDNIGAEGDSLLSDVETFDQLFWTMQQYIEENNLGDQVEVKKGDGYVFLTFRNSIFFEGDSYALRTEGARVLDAVYKGMKGIMDDIDEIRVLGHTNQADPDNLNDVRLDRMLASQRATEVVVYLQNSNVPGDKLLAIGYGQHYPVAPFDTDEGRMSNRRVEMIISQGDSVDKALEEIYTELGIGGVGNEE